MTQAAFAHEDGSLRLVRAGGLVVAAWTDVPTVEQLRIVRRHAQDAEREHPGRSAYLNAILRGGHRFPAEVRAELGHDARDRSFFTRGVAHLVLLPGWQGPAGRAVVRSAIALARTPFPHRVFSDARSAARWLAARLDGSAEAILRAWDDARGA